MNSKAQLWDAEPTAISAIFAAAAELTADQIEQRRASMKSRAMPADYTVDGGIATIPMHGLMMLEVDWFERAVLGAVSTAEVAGAVKSAAADDTVKALLLHISSPGGLSSSWPELAAAVADAAKSKPVVAWSDDVMASAAYAVASQADRIAIGPNAAAGSIGSMITVADYSQFFKDRGIKINVVASGRFKGTGVMGSAVTDEQLGYVQESIDQITSFFKSAVQSGRRMSAQRVNELADGKAYIGKAALQVGLVDAVGRLDQVVGFLRKRIAAGATGAGPTITSGGAAARNGVEMFDDTKAREEVRKEERDRVAALSAAFPGQSAFVQEAISAGWSIEQAKAQAYDRQLVATAPVKLSGNRGLGGHASGDPAGGGDAVSARSAFDHAIRAEMKVTGCTRPQAASRVNARQPELRQQLVADANHGKEHLLDMAAD